MSKKMGGKSGRCVASKSTKAEQNLGSFLAQLSGELIRGAEKAGKQAEAQQRQAITVRYVDSFLQAMMVAMIKQFLAASGDPAILLEVALSSWKKDYAVVGHQDSETVQLQQKCMVEAEFIIRQILNESPAAPLDAGLDS